MLRCRRGFAHRKQLPWLMRQADKIGRTHWVNQLSAAGAGLSTVIWIREEEAAAFWLTPALRAALSCSQRVVKQPRPSVSVRGPRPTADLLTVRLTQWAVNLLWFLLMSLFVCFGHEALQVLMFFLVAESPTLESGVGGSERARTKTKRPSRALSSSSH